jgi:hypothetical protein
MRRTRTASFLAGLAWALVGPASSAAQEADVWVIGGQGGEPWADVQKQWIALEDTSRPGSVQPVRITKELNLMRERQRSELSTELRNLFNYRWATNKGPLVIEADTLQVGWHPRLWVGGNANANARSTREIMSGVVDGDELTAGFNHLERTDGQPNNQIFFTFDLGVPVPVDSVVFFPPQSGITSDNKRQRELFPIVYEVSRTNTPVEWLIFEDETTSTGSSGYHPLDEVIGSTFANNTSIVSLTPELAFTRFLRFRLGQQVPAIMLAEIKVFGQGYPQEGRYLSQPHRFGGRVSLGNVTWNFTRYRQTPSGEIVEDPEAPVELVLRTRAGSDDDPTAYYIFDDLGRSLRVEAEDYFRAPRVDGRFAEGVPGFRARRGDDTENWDNWSVAYDRSGTENRSSDGNSFFQFQFQIVTDDPLAFGVLDSLAFEVSPLLADSALAEVSFDGAPLATGGRVEVPLGTDTTFVYDIRTVAADGLAGFDGIDLAVPESARFVDLEIEDVTATEGEDYTVSREAGRLVLTFPETYTQDTRLRLRFRSAIFQASMFLEGRLLNRQAGTLPQSIAGGNARDDVGSNGVQLIASDTRFQVLRDLTLSSRAVTPNGDGFNDRARIAFNLFDIQDGALRVDVLELSGRRVRGVLDGRAASGPFAPTWDGTGEDGELVPPGLYLIRVEVDVDDGTQTEIRPVAVAY